MVVVSTSRVLCYAEAGSAHRAHLLLAVVVEQGNRPAQHGRDDHVRRSQLLTARQHGRQRRESHVVAQRALAVAPLEATVAPHDDAATRRGDLARAAVGRLNPEQLEVDGAAECLQHGVAAGSQLAGLRSDVGLVARGDGLQTCEAHVGRAALAPVALDERAARCTGGGDARRAQPLVLARRRVPTEPAVLAALLGTLVPLALARRSFHRVGAVLAGRSLRWFCPFHRGSQNRRSASRWSAPASCLRTAV